jgi:hypothetical protein
LADFGEKTKGYPPYEKSIFFEIFFLAILLSILGFLGTGSSKIGVPHRFKA